MATSRSTDFSFLPKDLLEKCTPFIIRYHELNGYSCLADILWHPEIRNFIETEASFQRLFRKSTSSRSAKRANEGLVSIASIILAVEVLSIGLPAGETAILQLAKRRRPFWKSMCRVRALG
jgi:hypothetical protein